MSNQVGYERQSQKGKSKSWSLRFFLIAINLFLLFLIVEIPIIQRFSFYLLLVSVLILVIKYGRKRLQNETATEDNIKDLFPLVGKYMKINRKFMLASIMGLILAILIISQIVILSNSTSGGAYNDVLNGGTVPLFEGRRWNDVYTTNDYKLTFANISDELNDRFASLADQEGFKAKPVEQFFEYELYQNIAVKYDTETFYNNYQFRNHPINEAFFNQMKRLPTFPKDSEYFENISILTISDWIFENSPGYFADLVTNNNVTFQTSYENGENVTIHFDYIWVLTEQDRNFGYQHGMYDLINNLDNKILIPLGSETTFFKGMDLTYRGDVISGYVEISSLEDKKMEDVLASVRFIKEKLQSFIFERGFNTWLDSPLEWRLQDYSNQGAAISFVLLLVSVPMLGIALYLVYFSLNLVEIRKQKLVSIMKIRGISSGQLKVMMTVEALIAAIIASAIGMVLSIPWSQFVFSSSGIFGDSTNIIVPTNWYWRIPVIGLILAINLNIGSILSISSTSVEEGEVSEEVKEPFWRRLYLDVIFTVLGAGFWIVIRVVSFPIQDIYFFLLVGVGPFALLFLIVGLPLFVSRYYSDFLTILSDFLWKREGNLIALATRNMRKNKYSASKLAVLLMVGMLFSFVAISVPYSFTTWIKNQSYYQIGADMSVENVDTSNSTLLQPLDTNAVKAYTEVQSFRFNVYTQQYQDIKILAVDPGNYNDVAFWDRSYASESLSSMMSVLKEGKILVEKNGLDVLKLEKGDNLIVSLDNATLNERIGGSFDYWPILRDYLWVQQYQVSSLMLVMSLSTFHNYANPSTSTMLIDLNRGVNSTLAQLEMIKAYTQLNGGSSGIEVVNSAAVLAEQQLQLDEISLLFTLFDTLLIITLAASVIGVGYFSFITLAERRREIGVFRAVGMVSKQIFFLLVVESVIMVTTAIIVGALAGLFVSSNLFLMFESDWGDGPPVKLKYPPLLTTLFVLGMMVLSVVAAAIPARTTATRQTGSILRAE